MSKAIDDGGPAFPCPILESEKHGGMLPDPGMSLRDWFAGMALQGILSNGDHLQMMRENNLPSEVKALIVAGCYLFADVMLAERKRNE